MKGAARVKGVLGAAVDALADRALLGVGPGASPAEVDAVFGADFAENRPGRHGMWRDYGLFEFAWERDGGRSPWEGRGFTLQLHRLEWTRPDDVAPALRRAYGVPTAGRPVRVDALRAELARRGVELAEAAAGTSPGATLYRPAGRGRAAVLALDDAPGVVHRVEVGP